MSWFEYGTPQRRSLRKGVCLRVRDLPPNLVKDAKKLMRRGEHLQMVQVLEIRPKGHVLLQFWSRRIGKDPFNRHTVFTIYVKEDPEWICEGDIGRGYRC